MAKNSKKETLIGKTPSKKSSSGAIAAVVAGAAAVSALDGETQASQAGLSVKQQAEPAAALNQDSPEAPAAVNPDFQVDINKMLLTLEEMFTEASSGVDAESIAEQLADAFPQTSAGAEQLPFEMLLAQSGTTATDANASDTDEDDDAAYLIPTQGLIAGGLLGAGILAGGTDFL